MIGESRDDPLDDGETVAAAVEREVRPRVRVALVRAGRQVRRIGEDPIEPSESLGEVGANGVDPEVLVPSAGREFREGRRVEVRRDDRPARAGRGQAELAVPGSDLEETPGAPLARKPSEEFRVLAHRIDARAGPRIRETVGS
jgi:hypothetical protein